MLKDTLETATWFRADPAATSSQALCGACEPSVLAGVVRDRRATVQGSVGAQWSDNERLIKNGETREEIFAAPPIADLGARRKTDDITP